MVKKISDKLKEFIYIPEKSNTPQYSNVLNSNHSVNKQNENNSKEHDILGLLSEEQKMKVFKNLLNKKRERHNIIKFRRYEENDKS
jgi:hypothetical protein